MLATARDAPPPGSEPPKRSGDRRLLATLLASAAPIDLRIVGRTLLHAALVGAAAGLVSAMFFGALEIAERLILSGLVGYLPMRAAGETFLSDYEPGAFRPWLLIFLPAAGALVGGLLTAMV